MKGQNTQYTMLRQENRSKYVSITEEDMKNAFREIVRIYSHSK